MVMTCTPSFPDTEEGHWFKSSHPCARVEPQAPPAGGLWSNAGATSTDIRLYREVSVGVAGDCARVDHAEGQACAHRLMSCPCSHSACRMRYRSSGGSGWKNPVSNLGSRPPWLDVCVSATNRL